MESVKLRQQTPKDYAMPTLLGRRSLTMKAKIEEDATPFLVVIAVSLLIALAYCAAFAPGPMPDTRVAIMQGGL